MLSDYESDLKVDLKQLRHNHSPLVPLFALPKPITKVPIFSPRKEEERLKREKLEHDLEELREREKKKLVEEETKRKEEALALEKQEIEELEREKERVEKERQMLEEERKKNQQAFQDMHKTRAEAAAVVEDPTVFGYLKDAVVNVVSNVGGWFRSWWS